MKRLIVGFAVAALAALLPAGPAGAQASVDIHIGAPPPPPVIFHQEPEVVLVPQTHVYYVPDVDAYDMYRYGPYWYIDRDGYWYRSRDYGGPFQIIQFSRVPGVIVALPHEYRHHPRHPHGGPPGHVYPHGEGHGHGHEHDEHGHH